MPALISVHGLHSLLVGHYQFGKLLIDLHNRPSSSACRCAPLPPPDHPLTESRAIGVDSPKGEG